MNAETAEAWVLPVLLIVLPLVWTATRDWFSREARTLRRIEAWQTLGEKASDEATRAAIEGETELMVRDLVARQQVARERAGFVRDLVRGPLIPSMMMAIGTAAVVTSSLGYRNIVDALPEGAAASAAAGVVVAVVGVGVVRSWRERVAVRAIREQMDQATETTKKLRGE
ncbi:hypothetical protein ACFVBP_10335 [Nocardioides sp. NPDC057764]|uniref:hypothetical protein n=1 Tax=Nocardioides sp. NPDC057764 TaxID=3346243 RepID=UPI0036704663